jgi:DNA-binding SARP family transcriptional activator
MLKIQSLGRPMLERNGRRIRLNAGMPVAVEVLCYFIHHDTATVETVVNDIFAHAQPDQARRYFHMIRNELHLQTLLRIKFDAHTQHYRLESSELLEWDVQHFKNALRSGTATFEDYGLFLPTSSSAWVQRERDRLENDFVIATLNTLSTLEASGHGKEHKMLERLVRMLPMNERVLGFCVRHTARKAGREVATEQLEMFKQRFQITGLPIPETLDTCMSLH